MIVKRDNKYVYVNYFRRINDDFDLKVCTRRYSFKDINKLIEGNETRDMGEFFRDKNIGDVLVL